MATIRKRVDSKGQARFEAIIRLKRKGALVHRESRTFGRRAMAVEWAKARELELERPGAVEALRAPKAETQLGKLAARYREYFSELGGWGRTKHAALKALEGMEIAQADATTLTAAQLVAHVRARRLAGAGPSTAGQDLTWIATVLKAARSVWGLPVHPYVVSEARDACKELRLIGKSRRRDRRPTADELAKLKAKWARANRNTKVPMGDIVDFAIASGRRQDEIANLRWEDLHEDAHTILVRDVKHPDGSEGNHRTAKLTADALAIILQQPRNGPLIFPLTAKAMSANFTRSCKLLGIQDLHFHDLRHEATSRLFEAGYQIQEVAQFTLHESWQELKRYTNLRPENLKLR